MDFVLDASVTLAWCFKDEQTAATNRLLEQLDTVQAFVPGLWTLEIGNILLSASRKQRISYAHAKEFLNLLSELNIQVDEVTASLGLHDIFLIAHAEHLTTHDAAYLELAMRKGLPLATRDQQLTKAASKLGVLVL